MIQLSILVCFTALLQVSLSSPILASKPKPVDLAFTCTTIINVDQEHFKQDHVPIILIHGKTLNKESWGGLIELFALETRKKVCAVDLRNHGQSPWNDKEYNVIAMTEDIRHFMDKINAPKAIILGHSLGGKIAVHLALNYPERAEKIIVEDMRPNGVNAPALEGSNFYGRMLLDVQKFIPQGVSENEAKRQVLHFIKEKAAKMNTTFELDDFNYMPIKCSDGKCQLSINPVLLEALLRNDTDLHSESSGLFNGPALFIYGTESLQHVDEDESNIKRLFPNAELVAVEGAGHTVHIFRKFEIEVIKFINNKRN